MVNWQDVFFQCTVFCLLFFCVPIKVNGPKELLFLSYIDDFNKIYKENETEFAKRFDVFKATLDLIDDLNKNRTHNSSARYGITQFSDLSQSEFLEKHLVRNLHSKMRNKTRIRDRHRSKENEDSVEEHDKRMKRALADVPPKVDWRQKGVVSKINNQKTCGACWAFSTVEMVESINAIKTGALQEFSVQEMIDCSTNGNEGCEGGDICSLLEWLYVKQIKIEPANEYPLQWSTSACKLPGTGNGIQIADYTCQSYINNEEEILSILANHGPVAVAVNALSWQNYLGGVIQFHCDGSSGMLNHAVEIVGYDQTAEIPHYIARNSWGDEFGDKGYIYIAIGSNVCGLAVEVATAAL